MDELALAARAALAIWLGIAGALKCRDTQAFRRAVRHYHVLPRRLGTLYGAVVPPTEIGLAVLLAAGVTVGLAGLLAACLVVSFTIGVSLNLLRGRTLECHCLGRTFSTYIGMHTVVMDVLLLGPAMFLLGYALSNEGLLAPEWPLTRAAPSGLGLLLGAVYASIVAVPNMLAANEWHVRRISRHWPSD